MYVVPSLPRWGGPRWVPLFHSIRWIIQPPATIRRRGRRALTSSPGTISGSPMDAPARPTVNRENHLPSLAGARRLSPPSSSSSSSTFAPSQCKLWSLQSTPSYYPSSHNARITLIVSIRDSIRYYRGSWNVCSNIRVFEFYLYVVCKVKSNNQLINRLIDVSFQKYMTLKMFVHRTFFFSSI